MPRADVLIVGQGLAGTALGWACENADVPFEIVDATETPAASAVAAGILNPITGRRLVKGWRAEELLPLARATYGAMPAAGGSPCWHDVRIRRLFADDRERAAFAAKQSTGELAPFVGGHDDEGFWIVEAGRIESTALVDAARRRWHEMGRFRRVARVPAEATNDYALVIDCRGLATVDDVAWSAIPWEYSKGQLISIRARGLDPAVVLNRRHWVAPVDHEHAWVGATHEPGLRDTAPTAAGREGLEAAARSLLQRPFAVLAHAAGVRVTLRDKLPVVGRHPVQAGLGIVNALGAKGATWAPWLARQWVEHLTHGAPFDPAVDVARFFGS